MTAAMSRRQALLSCAAVAVPAAALSGASTSLRGPDAELIRLCADFEALQRQINAVTPGYPTPAGCRKIVDDDERLIELQPLHDRQEELLSDIFALRATTHAGFKARARMARLYIEDLLNPDYLGGWDQVMVAALIRDMSEGAQA